MAISNSEVAYNSHQGQYISLLALHIWFKLFSVGG